MKKITVQCSILFILCLGLFITNVTDKEIERFPANIELEQENFLSKLKYHQFLADAGYKISLEQDKKGVFYPKQCANKAMTFGCRTEKSIFTHSLIMDSLYAVKNDPVVDKVKEKGLKYLVDQKKKYGDYLKYFQYDRFLMKKIVLPDSDDNSVIPSVLFKYGHTENTANHAEQMKMDGLKLNTFKNRNGDQSFTGNIFETWLPPKDPLYNDLDVVVQANALWYYGLQGQIATGTNDLAGVCSLVNTVVDWVSTSDNWQDFYGNRKWVKLNKTHYSVWYPSQFTFIYNIVRAYVDGKQKCLEPSIEKIYNLLESKNQFAKSKIENALAISAHSKLIRYYQEQGDKVDHKLTVIKIQIDTMIETEKKVVTKKNKTNKFYFYGSSGYVGSNAYKLAVEMEAVANYLAMTKVISHEYIESKDLNHSIEEALDYFKREQQVDGSLTKMIEVSSIYYNAFMILLYEFSGTLDDNLDNAQGLMKYIFSTQNMEGGFSGYPNGPYDHGVSILGYMAGKIVGESEDSPDMLKLEKKINANGGIVKGDVKTLVFGSLMGLTSLDRCVPRVAMNLLMSMKAKLPWIRVMIYPAVHILSNGHAAKMDKSKYPNRIGSFKNMCKFFPERKRIKHKNEDKLFEWLTTHTNEDGTFFDYTPTTVFALMAYATKMEEHKEIFDKGLKTLQSFQLKREGGIYQSPGEASIGETYVLLNALIDMEYDLNSEMVTKAEDFLYSVQQPNIHGFGFSKHNKFYPDSDDTSNVILVLEKLMLGRGKLEKDKVAKLDKAMELLLTFQNRDGGFATWEKKRLPLPKQGSGGIMGKLPVLAESVVEHTARIALHLSSQTSKDERFKVAYDKAISYLLKNQLEDGSYRGTWFVNYLFGTSMSLVALATDHTNPKAQVALEKALRFLLKHQNADGGFSETLDSFIENKVTKLETSSPAQTGLIVAELMVFLEMENYQHIKLLWPHIEASVVFLIKNQEDNGVWNDTTFTGVTFPKIEYLYYPYVQEIEPMHVLGLYKVIKEKVEKGIIKF